MVYGIKSEYDAARDCHCRQRKVDEGLVYGHILLDPASRVLSARNQKIDFSNWGEGEEEGKGKMGKC